MKVAVLGTGGWGLTLGQVLHDNGHNVAFWTHAQEEVEILTTQHEYKDKLPGVIFPESFTYSTDMSSVVADADIILLVVPSQFMLGVAKTLGSCVAKDSAIVVSATKGILESTLQRMSEVLLSNVSWLTPEKMVALSGPTHAEEVSRRIYTAIVAACPCEASAKMVQQVFSNSYMRVYTSDDIVGVEICGSVKNVIAIASGVLYGLGAGDNTRAALLTRGQAEMCRLGIALGANPHTFAGLAGMGDLIVTCLSEHSRNRYVGEHIGKGESLEQILKEMKMIAEGVPTCRSAKALAEKSGVEMPLVNAVYESLFNGKSAQDSIRELMGRELKSEIW